MVPGWAASVIYNPRARAQFQAFHRRKDTFSLGVCNGCQLMALLGWVGTESSEAEETGKEDGGLKSTLEWLCVHG